jgi:hypothetical protein
VITYPLRSLRSSGRRLRPGGKLAALEGASCPGKRTSEPIRFPAPIVGRQGYPTFFFQVGTQILQQRDKITFLYLRDHEFRNGRLNQPHPAHVTPSWYGDSVGYYEGDTLVIDTIGVKADRYLAMLDFYGTPYTQVLHIVERYRLLDCEAAQEGLERDAKANNRIANTCMQREPDYRASTCNFCLR